MQRLAHCLLAAMLSMVIFSTAWADVCTAPGHSECTITCPAGCTAQYVEPDGPCSTMCSAPSTQTCTAPGHPDCSITCQGGCVAGYSEPDGPCTTFCSGSLSISSDRLNLTIRSPMSRKVK